MIKKAFLSASIVSTILLAGCDNTAKIPETKNKSLEEIEGYWIKGDKIPSNPLS